jgi:predicted nicotinamide N-methyase
MRRVLIGDLLAAADLLARLPAPQRRARIDRLLDEAHAAHRYMRRFGRPHPRWGCGGLLARVLAEGAGTGHGGDITDFAALAEVAAALAAFRGNRGGRAGAVS